MFNRKLQRWLAVGVSEVIISLILIAAAPNFLNSKKPIFGFLIWFTVPTVLASSSIYAIAKLAAARKARRIFLTAFPEYSYLEVGEFLDLPPAHVASQIALLRSAQKTTEFEAINISLFEILEQTKDEKI